MALQQRLCAGLKIAAVLRKFDPSLVCVTGTFQAVCALCSRQRGCQADRCDDRLIELAKTNLRQRRLVKFVPIVKIVQVHGISDAEASSAMPHVPRMPLRFRHRDCTRAPPHCASR